MDLSIEFSPDKTPVLSYSPWPKPKTVKDGKLFVLWPVFAYKVLAPRPIKKELNLFQKAVLGLCRAGQQDPDSIAKRLHLEREIVKFVLSELRHTGFIAKNNIITTTGESILTTEMDRLPDEIVSAYVFQDPWEGRLWPGYRIRDRNNSFMF